MKTEAQVADVLKLKPFIENFVDETIDRFQSMLEDEWKLLEFEILMSYALQGDRKEIADKLNEYRRDERTMLGASGEEAVEAFYQEYAQW
jgi:tetrahydromethanopterin S-methyltransferase subunit A